MSLLINQILPSRHDPGSGNLITFSQFLFVALEGFFVTQKFGTKKRNIGFKDYLLLVIMFFVTSVANNYAFDFNIPMPLHMIFRAVSFILLISIIMTGRYLLMPLCPNLHHTSTGLADSKHGDGNRNLTEALCNLKVLLSVPDNDGHCHLHDCIGQWNCKLVCSQ